MINGVSLQAFEEMQARYEEWRRRALDAEALLRQAERELELAVAHDRQPMRTTRRVPRLINTERVRRRRRRGRSGILGYFWRQSALAAMTPDTDATFAVGRRCLADTHKTVA